MCLKQFFSMKRYDLKFCILLYFIYKTYIYVTVLKNADYLKKYMQHNLKIFVLHLCMHKTCNFVKTLISQKMHGMNENTFLEITIHNQQTHSCSLVNGNITFIHVIKYSFFFNIISEKLTMLFKIPFVACISKTNKVYQITLYGPILNL